MLRRKRRDGGKVRIADLGAGSGEALRLMTSINIDDADLEVNQAKVLSLDEIDLYVGSDLCEQMVEQGRENFALRENVRFEVGDFSQGFTMRGEEPFDFYGCSFASFSHIDATQLRRLFQEMFEHQGESAVYCAEFLGRHSIEWPCYWNENDSEMLPYSMSWLPGEAGGDAESECFPMRYWLGPEILGLIREVAKAAAVRMRRVDAFDCSVFVGRHVDTGEYNDWVRPLRRAVNSLHEPNVRTDLDKLRAEVVPVEDHDELNGYYAGLQFQWNSLVEYCCDRLRKRIHPVHLKNWRQYPPSLQMAMVTLDRVTDTAYWAQMGDPRANVIEPHLGYALRSLEDEYQSGLGRGHSLIVIFEAGR
jgi:SAM-dependent methyltransferase